MEYLIDGQPVSMKAAKRAFAQSYLAQGGDPDAVNEIWTGCRISEGARDVYLPAHIEIVTRLD